MAGMSRMTGKYGDQHILTNGHMAFVVPADSPLLENARDFPKAATLWAKLSVIPAEPQPVGDIYVDGPNYWRKIGGLKISERYFRCFDGPGVTWMPSTDRALVHQDGELVGIIMRCKDGNEILCLQPVSDWDVFGPFACADNNWYLINEVTLRRRLADAQRQRRNAKDRLEEAQADVDDLSVDIRSLEKRLADMQAAGVK